MKVQAVFIEASHGRSNKLSWISDPGVVGSIKMKDAIRGEYVEQIKEHTLAKEIVIKVVDILKEKPELATAIVTGVGTSEKGASINEKVKYVKSVINNNRLDITKTLGVAIHFNSGGGSGTESFYQHNNNNSIWLADCITSSIDEYTKFGFHNIKCKPDTENRLGRLYISDFVINGKYSNYILLEVCYVDNDKQIRYVLDNKQRVAESIAHGILEYIRKY